MASDRHGKHNTTTISFRVNSYEKATIEERVKVSGMKKQDYIVRSCIYNHVCVKRLSGLWASGCLRYAFLQRDYPELCSHPVR